MALTNNDLGLTTLADGEAPEPGAGGIIPPASPTQIPGLPDIVSTVFGYGLWLVVLAGVGGVGFGLFKLATVEKSGRGGSASEPFKWMGGGVIVIMLAGTVINILNGVTGV